MERVCIYPSDVCNITGRKLRFAQNLLKHLRIVLKKEAHQYITKQELADFLDIDAATIKLR